MKSPKVSIIIPAYNQADYVPAAIQSVLGQTYTNWELLVVDDGSTDATGEAVNRFSDPRIRYIHQLNRGLPGARNTGISHASGEYLAFLDADDLYHPEKLAVQVSHLDLNSDVGLSYTSRIEIDRDGNPMWLLRAPATASLTSLVLGFPFTINDLLMRREWIDRAGAFDESFALHSEDRDFYLRLALAGCQFVGVDRYLAYRRLHAGRIFTKIEARLETMLRALETAFSDPHCPVEVKSLRHKAQAQVYLPWMYQAFFQKKAEMGQEYLQKAIQLDPLIITDHGQRFLNFLVWASIRDGGDHEDILRQVIARLPSEMGWVTQKCDEVIAQGYLKRGVSEIMWGRLESGRAFFDHAGKLDAQIDEPFLRNLADQLLNYETEFGCEAAQSVLSDLAPSLEKLSSRATVRWLKGCYQINRAFKIYRAGEYNRVPEQVIQAISNDPKHLINRGVLSIVFRSILETFNGARV